MKLDFILLLLTFIYLSRGDTPGTARYLPWAVQKGARCLDGSPPMYYIQKASQSSDVNKWFLHHEEGGWCEGLTTPVSEAFDSCYARSSTYLGSTTNDPKLKNMGGGYFSQSSQYNPLMYGWNHVFLRYCDGGSFTGTRTTPVPVNDRNLYFAGKLILQALRDDLYYNNSLQYATDVVVSGCSAGGMAVYIHLDWWKSQLPPKAHVTGLADSGFFLDRNIGQQQFSTGMQWVYYNMKCQGGVMPSCLSRFSSSDQWKCMFPEHFGDLIQTRLFILQSEFDAWQLTYILNFTGSTWQERQKAYDQYALDMQSTFNKTFGNDPRVGYHLDTCHHHCGLWDNFTCDGMTDAAAQQKWYQDPSANLPTFRCEQTGQIHYPPSCLNT